MISKEDLKKIYRAAIDAANPEKAIHDCLRLKKNILEVYADDKIIFLRPWEISLSPAHPYKCNGHPNHSCQ